MIVLNLIYYNFLSQIGNISYSNFIQAGTHCQG